MKTLISFIMTLVLSQPLTAQTQNELAKETILQFAKATDERDVYSMHYLLHENFQGMVGENAVNKSDYMKMLGEKKLGGIQSTVEIIHLETTEKVSTAKVRVIRNSETLESVYHLYKSTSGWQVLYVLPYQILKA